MSATRQHQIESTVDKMNATTAMTATTAKGQTPPAHVGMFQLLNGVFVTGAISCLAWLGVPDLVEHGPKSAEELATHIGADPRVLYRLLRATASVGVLSESTDGKFSETPLSAVLRRATQFPVARLRDHTRQRMAWTRLVPARLLRAHGKASA